MKISKKARNSLITRMIMISLMGLLLSLTDVSTLNARTISILIGIGVYLFCLGWYFSKKYYSERELTHNNNFRRDPAKPWWEDR